MTEPSELNLFKLEDIVNQMIPELKEVLLEHIINKVHNVDIGDQNLQGASVTAQYDVRGTEGSITFSVEPGVIKGTQIVDVPSHNRGGSEVRGHTRTYEDQRVFRLSNGDYITTDTLPNELLDKAIGEAFGEALDEA